MAAPKDLLVELASLTQLYLFQEFKVSDWIFSEPESYAFFKRMASVQKKQLPSKAPPPSEKIIVQETAPAPLKDPPPQKMEAAIKELPERSIRLEPMEGARLVDFSDLKAIIGERYPGLKIMEDIPDDAKAKQKPKVQNLQVAVIYLSCQPLHQAFLANLTQAIDICLAPATLVNAAKVENEQGWISFLNASTLKIILFAQQDLVQLPDLAKNYTQGNQPNWGYLGKIPCFHLRDIALILKEPVQKQLVWSLLEKFFKDPPLPDEK